MPKISKDDIDKKIKKLVPISYGANNAVERELIEIGNQALPQLFKALKEFESAKFTTERNLKRDPNHDHLSWQLSAYKTAIRSTNKVIQEISAKKKK